MSRTAFRCSAFSLIGARNIAAIPSITNTSSIWPSKTSTTLAQRPGARKRMELSNDTTRRCSTSSTASPSARRSMRRSASCSGTMSVRGRSAITTAAAWIEAFPRRIVVQRVVRDAAQLAALQVGDGAFRDHQRQAGAAAADDPARQRRGQHRHERHRHRG